MGSPAEVEHAQQDGILDHDPSLHLIASDPPGTGGGAASHRRWDDQPRPLPTLTLTRFLARQPDLDTVARFLVGMLSYPIAARGIVFARESTSGGPVILAEYVEPAHDSSERTESADVPLIVADLCSTGSSHQAARSTTDRPSGTTVCAMPLGSPLGSVGVLIVFLSRCMDPGLVTSRLEAVADILAVYLAGVTTGIAPPVRRASTPALPIRGSAELTPRQIRILQLMSDELTNRQIAGRIGFSESTVRAESLVIYRSLGVRNRRQAAETGRSLGILVPSDSTTPAAAPRAVAEAAAPPDNGA